MPRLIPTMELEAKRWEEGVPESDWGGPYPPDAKVAAVFSQFATKLEGIADKIEARHTKSRQDGVGLFDAFNPRNLECSVSL
jgi:hypothetical protein